ncbi:glycosyltransferase [Aureimonas frigidaquae]|nr:glycosyltransferase [Aureimonas frigidaquae]
MNDITVLIPTYNHSRFIKKALDSVTQQSLFRSLVIVVSDDKSRDDTFEKSLEFAKPYDNISVISNDHNLGIMRHYKSLIDRVNTPYVAILEGDDYWINERKLDEQLRLMKLNEKMECAFTGYRLDFQGAAPDALGPSGFPQNRHRLVYFPELLQENIVATFSTCLYRTEAIRDLMSVPSIQDGYDWLINLVLAARSPLGFLGRHGTNYRVHPSGTWSRMSESERKGMLLSTLHHARELVSAHWKSLIDARIKQMEVK